MTYTAIVLNAETFDELLRQAPESLALQARSEAERVIAGLCFTESDIREKCEEQEAWQRLSLPERAKVIEWLLESDEYQYITEMANWAIAEAVEQYFDVQGADEKTCGAERND